MKTTSSKQEFDWKVLGETTYMYSLKTGKVLGRVFPADINATGSLYGAGYDGEFIGEYVNEAYAKAAVLEAASLAVTKKILNKAAGPR